MENYIYKDKVDEEYYERFLPIDVNSTKTSYEKALDIALDTRKFEIDLYWKRANYFWLFVAAMFTAFFVVANNLYKEIEVFDVNLKVYHKVPHLEFMNLYFLLIISFLGFTFSLGWYYVNRASKFWQNNWEAHVDLLSKKNHGELFTTIKASNRDFWKLDKEYPFSVSRVNQLLSLITTFIWMIMFLGSIYFLLSNKFSFSISDSCNIIFLFVSLLIFLIYIFVFTNYSKSFIKDFKNKDSNISFYLKD